MQVKATSKQKSQKAQAQEWLNQYRELEKQNAKLLEKSKAIKEQQLEYYGKLLEYAEDNPGEFVKKKCQLENGELVWRASSRVVVGDQFDWEDFQQIFPHLVKESFSVSITDLRPYLKDARMSDFEIGIESKDNFKVNVDL